MSRYWIGCSTWTYADWVGPFYPAGTASRDFLELYARVFRTVEVDSTSYRVPAASAVRGWATRTPGPFRFALKVPRDVTHGKDDVKEAAVLASFLSSLDALREVQKLGPVVLQFPPSFRAPSDAPKLERLLTEIPVEFHVAVELRHGSWWTPATRHLLEERDAALVWSVIPGTEPPAWVTGDFVYARFVGDRSLTRFDRIQRDRRSDIEKMRSRFEDEARSSRTVYAYATNHFTGFGPGTAVAIAEALGLPAPDLAAAGRAPGQQVLGGTGGPDPAV
jgi:uncharacterized protein YecE (DUF72 family)